MKLSVNKAFKYYQFLLRTYKKKSSLYQRLGFSTNGAIHYRDWEVFGAILVGDTKKHGTGIDLTKHEIKSALEECEFSYQYHRNTGLDKLKQDMAADHIFITYKEGYESITVRRLSSEMVAPLIEPWRESIVEAYYHENKRQRCRHHLRYTDVVQLGTVIMCIEGGQLRTSDHAVAATPTIPCTSFSSLVCL